MPHSMDNHTIHTFALRPLPVTCGNPPLRIMRVRNHGANMVSVPHQASSHGSRVGRNSRSLRRVVEPEDERSR